MRTLLMAIGLLIISACQAGPGSLEAEKDQALTALVQAQQVPQSTTPEQITFAEQLYVPSLSAADYAQPSWYSKPVSVRANELAIGAMLEQVFTPHQIGIRLIKPELGQHHLKLSHQGTLGSFIEQVRAKTGWHVTLSEEQVVFSEYQVAEFDVAFIAGDTNYFLGNKDQQLGSLQNNRAPTSVTSMTNGSDSQQFLNFSSQQLSVWNDLERALNLLLSAHGEVSINQSSTSVLVRDFPHHVTQVRNYIEQQNERLTRQVAIEVQILEVTFNDESQFSVDWQALLQTAGGKGVLGLTSANFGGTQGTRLSWQQVEGSAAGSTLFLTALEQQGVVRTSNHPRLISLNNQIAKIQLEDNATYLAAAGTTATANVGSSTILQPGLVSTGFELYVLPSIRDREVILQLSTELSDLERIDEVRSGDQLIQTPHTNRKKFFMKALVNDGETLLMSGLRNERVDRTQQQSWLSLLLGGSNQRSQRHSETLVLLTPRVLQRGKS